MASNQITEREYYQNLASLLETRNFSSFKDYLTKSIEFNIHVKPQYIPKRFEIMSDLLRNAIKNVSELYQTSSLGEFIEILRFGNEYNLFERELDIRDLEIISEVKKSKLLISNLENLFGKITNSFILYIREEIPQLLYELLTENPVTYFQDTDTFIYYVKNVFFNQYTIYGLSVKLVSTIDQFLKDFKRNYSRVDQKHLIDDEKVNENSKKFIEFNVNYKYFNLYDSYEDEHKYIIVKKHLVSPNNILKNLGKIKSQDIYNFYSLSMVLLGGIGPQGHGFTYSTPRGEVVEICSDIKENEAIIIKYKQFLRDQFLRELEKELIRLKVEKRINVINYLKIVLDKKELINYNKKDQILSQIRYFLYEDFQNELIDDFQTIMNKCSKALSIILRPIKMIDQFKARMELIAKDKLKSEDIAKLTSLKNKSHFDVLRERFFFQFLIDWLYEIYIEKK